MKDVLYHLITIDMLFKGGINMYKKVGIILISAILILGVLVVMQEKGLF